MEPKQPAKARAMTMRSLGIGLLIGLLWTVAVCFITAAYAVRTQHVLLIAGFGAILTVFLLRFPLFFMILTVALLIVTSGYMYAGASPDDYSILTGGILRSLIAIVPMLLLALWVYLRPLRRRELVVVYACVIIAIPWAVCMRAAIESSVANLFEVQRDSEPNLYRWARALPWWAPSIQADLLDEPPADAPEAEKARVRAINEKREKDAALQTTRIINGFARGSPDGVPWRHWIKPVAYWTGMCLCWQGMLMGLLMMFRKRFIEHERLPFIYAQPAVEIIKGPETARRPSLHWILFAIGLGLCLPSVIFMSPTGESLSSWGCLPWAGNEGMAGVRAGVDLTELNLLPGTPVKLFWGPMVLALFLLFPVDVLMTTALTYILLGILLPGLMRSFGINVGPKLLGEFVKNGLRFGGGVGLIVWSLWFNRKTLWGYARSLWGGGPADDASRDEIGRRRILIIFVVGLVGFITLGCYATNLVEMSILTGLVLVYSFSQVRLRIEGLPMSYDNNFGSHQMVSIQRDFLGTHFGVASQDPNATVTGDGWATHWYQWGFNGQMKSLGPHNMLLEAFKVAHELRVNARDVAKAVLITMLLVAVVTPVLFITVMHAYGFETNFTGKLTTWHDFMQWSERAASYGIHSTSQVFMFKGETGYAKYKSIFHLFYGIGIIGILFYLRREYPRFPFSPVGVVIAAEFFYGSRGMPVSADHVWFSYLVVWIAKLLIFRWLGVRYFRERIVPAAIMLLCGMIFGMTIYIFRHIGLLSGIMT